MCIHKISDTLTGNQQIKSATTGITSHRGPSVPGAIGVDRADPRVRTHPIMQQGESAYGRTHPTFGQKMAFVSLDTDSSKVFSSVSKAEKV
jgi:hypothetical protein